MKETIIRALIMLILTCIGFYATLIVFSMENEQTISVWQDTFRRATSFMAMIGIYHSYKWLRRKGYTIRQIDSILDL